MFLISYYISLHKLNPTIRSFGKTVQTLALLQSVMALLYHPSFDEHRAWLSKQDTAILFSVEVSLSEMSSRLVPHCSFILERKFNI